MKTLIAAAALLAFTTAAANAQNYNRQMYESMGGGLPPAEALMTNPGLNSNPPFGYNPGMTYENGSGLTPYQATDPYNAPYYNSTTGSGYNR